jgi:hypothetical protein
MIGTTRSRVSFFMNKFRKLGFVDYDGELHVHSSLLNVVSTIRFHTIGPSKTYIIESDEVHCAIPPTDPMDAGVC